MSTVKFQDPSPYQVPRPAPPADDYVFARYADATALDHTKRRSNKTSDTVSLALFGCGRAGTVHLTNLTTNPRIKLLYVVEDVKEKWEALKTFWGLDETTKFLHSKDSKVVFEDPRVKAVVVASPTFTHEAIVKGALQAGKAVFCEKPIAEDIESARSCYELAKKVGRPLMCAFNRRFDATFGHVRRQVREGKVGHVHIIKTTSRDSPLPSIDYLKISGGIFHDCGVHDIDLVLWVLGELPTRVSAMANANVPEIKAINDYDTVAITLNFPSGTIGLIDLSRRSCYGYDQRLEVFGPRGMMSSHNERPQPGVVSQFGSQGSNCTPIWYSYPSRFKEAYAKEMDHFLDIVEGKAKLTINSRQILAVSKIASALEKSARTGRFIDLEWSKEEMQLDYD